MDAQKELRVEGGLEAGNGLLFEVLAPGLRLNLLVVLEEHVERRGWVTFAFHGRSFNLERSYR